MRRLTGALFAVAIEVVEGTDVGGRCTQELSFMQEGQFLIIRGFASQLHVVFFFFFVSRLQLHLFSPTLAAEDESAATPPSKLGAVPFRTDHDAPRIRRFRSVGGMDEVSSRTASFAPLLRAPRSHGESHGIHELLECVSQLGTHVGYHAEPSKARWSPCARQGPKEERAPPINAVAPDDIVFKPRPGD